MPVAVGLCLILSLIAPSTRRIISSTSAILTTSKSAYELHTITEPLSAFALAVNVIQVIDFSTKLLREAHELHESSTGHTAEHVELHQISQSLAHMCDSLSTAQPQSGVISHGVFEIASAKAIAHNVSKIAASAKAVAQDVQEDIIKTLSSLQQQLQSINSPRTDLVRNLTAQLKGFPLGTLEKADLEKTEKMISQF
jgi:hypothetical protein